MQEFEADVVDLIEAVGQNNFYTSLDFLFQTFLKRFETSSKSFSSILQDYHQELDKEIPLTLKIKLNGPIVMVISDFFGRGGFYPKISPFKRIPEEDLLSLCRTYFKENGFRDEVVIYLMYCFYIKSFEYIKINTKSLENSEIIKRIPQDLRSGIIKDYLGNYSFPIEVSIDKKQEMQRTALLPLEIGQKIIPQFINASFHDLSRIDKKVLLDLVWSVYVVAYYEKRRFTAKKLSIADREILIDLAINDYLELYNHFYKNKSTKKD